MLVFQVELLPVELHSVELLVGVLEAEGVVSTTNVIFAAVGVIAGQQRAKNAEHAKVMNTLSENALRDFAKPVEKGDTIRWKEIAQITNNDLAAKQMQ